MGWVGLLYSDPLTRDPPTRTQPNCHPYFWVGHLDPPKYAYIRHCLQTSRNLDTPRYASLHTCMWYKKYLILKMSKHIKKPLPYPTKTWYHSCSFNFGPAWNNSRWQTYWCYVNKVWYVGYNTSFYGMQLQNLMTPPYSFLSKISTFTYFTNL